MNHDTELYRGMGLTANEFYEIRVEIVETEGARHLGRAVETLWRGVNLGA
jgi:hypothetical protein